MLREDIEHLLTETAQFLARIDAIVDFTSGDCAAAGDAGGQHTLTRPPQPVVGKRKSPRPGTVLVVDDNISNRGLLTRRLSREGHRAIAVDSGVEALLLLEFEEVDLILLDVMMPGIDGFQVLQRLKADERFREIPVIMIPGCTRRRASSTASRPALRITFQSRSIPYCCERGSTLALERKRWHDRERRYIARIEAEKEKSETLLRNILPGQIIGRLNNGEAVIADRSRRGEGFVL